MTASASLVLLALVIQNEVNSEDNWYVIYFLGYLSAIIGFFYNEITQSTIQKHDFKFIRKTILDKIEPDERKEEVKKIILGPEHQRAPRVISFQLFLISPLLGWIYITIQWWVLIPAFAISLIIAFLYIKRHRERQKD